MLYDLIIVGAGPSGLTASLYASRYGLKHLIIGRSAGGTAAEAYQVENYPGCPAMTGNELMKKFLSQVKEYGVELVNAEIKEIKKGTVFAVKTNLGQDFKTKTIILAMGLHHRTLDVPGEKEFFNRGVTYCPTCDGPLFKDKTVAVVGGGDSALTSSLFLSKIAKKVYLIHCKESFEGQKAWQEKISQEKRIVKILSRRIKEIQGQQFLTHVVLNEPYENEKKLSLDGLFIEIGSLPAGQEIKFGPNLEPERDRSGYLIVDDFMQTNIPGLFAAGDITAPAGKLRQIITAAAEGAVSARGAQNFLAKNQSETSR